jgi:hypothetical protein
MRKQIKMLKAHPHPAANGPYCRRGGIYRPGGTGSLAGHDGTIDNNTAAINQFKLT